MTRPSPASVSRTSSGTLSWDKRALLTAATLERVQQTLSAAGIPVLVLKGPHVAVALYETPSERSWTDLDLLVHPSLFRAARGVLASAGFKEAPLTPGRRMTDWTTYCREMRSPFDVQVDLHRSLAPHGMYPVDVAGLFRRSVPFRFLHADAVGLCPEDMLVCLCIHVLKSCFYVEEKHFLDIALALKIPNLKWDQYLALITAAEARFGAWKILEVVSEAYKTLPPDHVMRDLRPSRWRAAWMHRYLDSSQRRPYRHPEHSATRIALRLRLPLLDRLSAWPSYVFRYGFFRLGDLFLSAFPRYNVADA